MAGVAQYVLITQCLQNDFFFHEDCNLCLPKDQAARLLFNADDRTPFKTKDGRRILPAGSRERSPLFQFLKTVVGGRIDGTETSRLHLINIRDWHVHGPHYDREVRLYGEHCVGGTPGANYINGFEQYLDPAGTSKPDPQPVVPHPWDERLTVHHVYSNTLFDFQEKDEAGTAVHKESPLARILEDIVRQAGGATLHVAVIGVLTDIKVQMLLVGLRSRYDFSQLAVSDALTASRTLARHRAALDYASKQLWVDVIDAVSDLAKFLGVKQEIRPVWGRRATLKESYKKYRDRGRLVEPEEPGPNWWPTVATIIGTVGTLLGGLAAVVALVVH